MATRSLYCTNCRFRLSAPLIMASGKDPAVEEPYVRIGKPLIDRGTSYKSWKPMPWLHVPPGHPLDFLPQIWMDPGDLTERVHDSPDGERLSGCCGPLGMNGPNKVCTCKVHVGTLQADCCTPVVFIPDPGATSWREGSADFWDYP